MDTQIPYYESVNPNLVAAMQPITGKRVLEIGCAAGRLGEKMKALGACQYVGVEMVPQVAELARGRLDHVVTGDIATLDLSFALSSFDFVVFGDVLEHLTDPWAVLRKCAGFLAPGGQVVASIPNINHISILAGLLQGRWQYTEAGLLDRTHLRFFTLQEILHLFEGAGLRLTSTICCALSDARHDALIADLEVLRTKHGLGGERFLVEARAYQWLVCATR